MAKIHFRFLVASALLVGGLTALPLQTAVAQRSPDPAPNAGAAAPDAHVQISWEVRNRFRLFREERDFLLHSDSQRDRSVLASEQELELRGEGRGWARNMVNRLCIDLQGRINEPCTRDNVKESYLTPTDHPVTVRLTGEVPVGAICAWSFDDGDGPQASTFDCAEPINLRARYGRTTVASVDVSSGGEAPQRVSTEITVRDLLIAGLGDSIASGEGNPDRAIALSDDGFCFRYYFGGANAQYYRPSRAGYKGGRACEAPDSLQVWQRQSALWFNSACHRSLYSYQTRTAIALAVRYPHLAVTYLPLACTGATIPDGLFGPQQAHECLPTKSANTCQGTVNAQVERIARPRFRCREDAVNPNRNLDLVLLSIGANDINFSGLVADVIVDKQDRARAVSAQRRNGLGGRFTRGDGAGPADRDSASCARRSGPCSVGDMSHVVYVSYANPTLSDGGAPCAGGRAGFDIHPSFNADPQRLANVSELRRSSEFLPQLKALALCQGGILCRDPRRRSHDLRRDSSARPISQITVSARARRERSAIRPGVFFGQGRQLRIRTS